MILRFTDVHLFLNMKVFNCKSREHTELLKGIPFKSYTKEVNLIATVSLGNISGETKGKKSPGQFTFHNY